MADILRGIWRGIHCARIGLAALLLVSAAGLSPVYAAPERLSDIIPDAVPDLEGKLNVSWNHQQLDLEGPFSSSSSSHDYIKLKYTFSPDTAGFIRYGKHDLSGDLGIVNPLFNNMDSGQSLEFDFAINLLNIDAVPADPAANLPYTAGSAFNLGVSATLYELEAGPLSQNETLLKAYLAYSTDLTDKLRAHTYFSTGRLSGDSASGSVNRIAAGLDYMIVDGCRPVMLMADGVLDVYNFRQPSFNTSRVTQFNLGARYKFADNWFATLGWQTVNDSENDASGSGIFAGVNFVDSRECCVVCAAEDEPAEEEAVPAEGQPLPETQPAPVASEAGPPAEPVETVSIEQPAESGAEESSFEQPPLMQVASAKPQSAPQSGKAAASADLPADTPSTLTEVPSQWNNFALSDADLQALHTDAGAPASGSDPGIDLPSLDAALTDDGVAIPPFPDPRPRHTAEGSQMVRPPLDSSATAEPQAEAATFESPREPGAALLPASDRSRDGESIEVLTGAGSGSSRISDGAIQAARKVLAFRRDAKPQG